MVESRCGVLCSECAYREKMHCKGCTKIRKPFWDSRCTVKDCCEKRALENCGFCKDIPCEMLKRFAEDKAQGDDGKRIKQCLEWAGKAIP